MARQGDNLRAFNVRPGKLLRSPALPDSIAHAGKNDVGAIDLIAGLAEVQTDRAEIGAPGNAVLHEHCRLGLVRVII